jgi:hypothetical protein
MAWQGKGTHTAGKANSEARLRKARQCKARKGVTLKHNEVKDTTSKERVNLVAQNCCHFLGFWL